MKISNKMAVNLPKIILKKKTFETETFLLCKLYIWYVSLYGLKINTRIPEQG